MAKSKKTPDFEQSLEQLENLVEALEAGDLTLEQSLKQFEEGITLTRACQTALSEAEQTVKILTEKSGQPALEDMDIDAADD
ncbi:MAG TPA: exodeoxyribonuclease VII small subunit [Cellvibrionales bacterium]|jgi:exodeoxyribonuclease VII small subunit|nr:exodeoxyribonuclease VII small subunit [Cellvibrionales bacterium]HAW13599.1 exodeoxyribonuclease VII small subunit [Cellvibrionales bacterium]HCX26581.1 exodeoxyribonuclease VII small subunit [Cellvibrionales bacterium]